MSGLYDQLLLMQASIDSSKASIDANKEYYDDKMKTLRVTTASIFDKLIGNVNHIFHQYQITSQENGVEDDGLSDITKSTSETKPYKSDPSSFRKPTQLVKLAHFHQLMSRP